MKRFRSGTEKDDKKQEIESKDDALNLSELTKGLYESVKKTDEDSDDEELADIEIKKQRTEETRVGTNAGRMFGSAITSQPPSSDTSRNEKNTPKK